MDLDLDHQICEDPYEGVKIYDRVQFMSTEINPEKRYKFTSTIAAKIQYANQICEKLNKKYKVACEVVARFKDYQFKFGSAILVIYHFIPFE